MANRTFHTYSEYSDNKLDWFCALFSDDTRKHLRTGAVPTMNLPTKSHSQNNIPCRKYVTLNIDDQKAPIPDNKVKPYFNNLAEFKKHVDSLKLSCWTKTTQEETTSVVLSLFDGIHHLPKYQLVVDSSLGFSISVYGWFLPDNHPIYMRHKRSVRFTKAFPLLSDVREL